MCEKCPDQLAWTSLCQLHFTKSMSSLTKPMCEQSRDLSNELSGHAEKLQCAAESYFFSTCLDIALHSDTADTFKYIHYLY